MKSHQFFISLKVPIVQKGHVGKANLKKNQKVKDQLSKVCKLQSLFIQCR